MEVLLQVLAPHVIDIARYLLAEMRPVTAEYSLLVLRILHSRAERFKYSHRPSDERLRACNSWHWKWSFGHFPMKEF